MLVLLHGRGSDETGMLALAPRLPVGAIVVAPRAPFPAAPWGYGPGWAWYRFIGGDRPEPESFAESLDRVHAFLGALPDALGVEPGSVVLGGFSQGGTMSLACALAWPGSVPEVLNLSGFLAAHPRVRATPDTVKGMRIFWAHGSEDLAVPYALAERGRAALRSAGAELTARDYPIGHRITPEVLREVTAWLAAFGSGPPPGVHASTT